MTIKKLTASPEHITNHHHDSSTTTTWSTKAPSWKTQFISSISSEIQVFPQQLLVDYLLDKEEGWFQEPKGKKLTLKMLRSSAAENITPQYRWILWTKLLNLHRQVSELPENCYRLFLSKNYEEHRRVGVEYEGTACSNVNNGQPLMYVHESISQILLDIPRSRLGVGEEDTHEMRLSEQCLIVERTKLFNVLYSLSMYYPVIGYCQGMSYIATLLLTVMESEEQVFLAMVTLMDRYNIKGLFTSSFPTLKQFQFVWDFLMNKRHTKLWKHLVKLGVTSPNLFIPKWVLTMFCLDFPEQFSYRVWDCFLIHGWKAIYQICCSLIVCFERELLKCQRMEQVIPILQDIPHLLKTNQEFRCKVFSSCSKMFKEKDMKEAQKIYSQL